MSNVATVTPYQSSRAGAETAAAVARVVQELVEALGTTSAERDVIARYKDLERRDRLAVASLDQRLAESGDLFTAARAAGYACGAADAARLGAGRPVELVGPSGDSILLRQSAGSLSVLSSGGQPAIMEIVRRVTLDRTRRHLESLSDGKVSTRRLANGEIELQARERREHADGAAAVTTRIDLAGVVHVDIDNIRGGRCEQVLAGVAEAVGGEVDTKTLKPAYYAAPAAPGEPARIRQGG